MKWLKRLGRRHRPSANGRGHKMIRVIELSDDHQGMAGYHVRRHLASKARQLSPSSSYCGACGMPWTVVSGHDTRYGTRAGRGCFPLCEACWSLLLRPERRLPYYEDLYADWCFNRDGTLKPETRLKELAIEWPYIKDAVLAGR